MLPAYPRIKYKSKYSLFPSIFTPAPLPHLPDIRYPHNIQHHQFSSPFFFTISLYQEHTFTLHPCLCAVASYVNFATGDEPKEEFYGDATRLERLRVLKKKWDAAGCFDHYNPIC
jgi:hypothetical protein